MKTFRSLEEIIKSRGLRYFSQNTSCLSIVSPTSCLSIVSQLVVKTKYIDTLIKLLLTLLYEFDTVIHGNGMLTIR